MENYIIIFAAIGAAIMIVGGIFSVYQLYQLVQTDAASRGIKHPKLWGFLASSGNSQSGLILYMIARRNYPVINITTEQKTLMEKNKRKIGVGLVFIVVGAIVCIWSIVFM